EPAADTPAPLAADIRLTRARAFFGLGETVAGVRSMVARGRMLKEPTAQAKNNQTLWQLLQQAPLSAQRLHNAPEAGTVSGGWIELARINRATRLNVAGLSQKLIHWQQQHPNHPANAHIVPE